jgi:hypothetical protein
MVAKSMPRNAATSFRAESPRRRSQWKPMRENKDSHKAAILVDNVALSQTQSKTNRNKQWEN